MRGEAMTVWRKFGGGFVTKTPSPSMGEGWVGVIGRWRGAPTPTPPRTHSSVFLSFSSTPRSLLYGVSDSRLDGEQAEVLDADKDLSDEDEEEEELNGEDLAEMDFEELEDVCDDKDLETDPDDYEEDDIEKLRKAIAKELGLKLPAKKEAKGKGKKGKK